MFKRISLVLAVAGLAISTVIFFRVEPASVSASLNEPSKRIRFDVAAFEERSGTRELLAETTVEGPPGTDFDIKLQGARFRMDARFVNDLVASESLQVRADLNTRRLYGQSERNLPLYEEDTQKQTLHLGFEEKLVLLPFGRNDSTLNSDQLKIEITPNLIEQTTSAKTRPLEIKILKASTGNLITVEATKVPHRFSWTVVLFKDGQEVAKGAAEDALVEQAQEISLKPNAQAGADVLGNPISLDLTTMRYVRNRPQDQVGFECSLHHHQTGQGTTEVTAPEAAGIAQLTEPMSYDVSDYFKSAGAKYELKLIVKLAAGEDAK